jgi:hypothetical protein
MALIKLKTQHLHGLQLQLDLDTRRIIAKDRSKDSGVFKDLDTSDVGFRNPLSVRELTFFAQYYKYKTADMQSIECLPPEDQNGRDQSVEESWVKIDGKSDIYTFRRYTGIYALAVRVHQTFIILHA